MTWMPDAPHGASLEDGRAAEATGAAGRIRLLAVDDEPAVLRALRSLFRSSAYDLHLAESGAEALKILGEHPIDVIISDMRMPGMDGMELLSEAKRRFPEPVRIVLSGYAEPDRVIGVLNEAGIFAYVSKPWDSADLKLKVHRAAEQLRLRQLTEYQNDQLERLNSSLEDKVRERTAELSSAKDRLNLALEELDESYRSVVKMLADMAERRMPAVRGHGQRVARTSRRLALALGLSAEEVRDIETAALLHDIGLVVVPDEILAVSPDCMTEDQLRQYQRHPVLGEITLIGIPVMRQVAAIIRSHHELYDGNGFPDGLVGEAIPLGARVVALANDYDSLLEAERTGEILIEEEAYARLCRDAGHRYDPRLLDLLGRVGRAPSKSGIQIDEVRVLQTEDLEPGMVLYEKLLSRDGMLLLSAGQRVSEQAIAAIRRLERAEDSHYEVYVYDRSEGDTDAPDARRADSLQS